MAIPSKNFLTPKEEEKVVEAIREAELHTSGEIRVHLESFTDEDPLIHAKKIFHKLKMDNTKLENGVLIYVAVNSKKFAIYGDRGINKVVPEGFWESTKDKMQEHFKAGRFKQGLITGIESAGRELQHYFPWDENDFNELTNEISTS